MDDTSLDTSDAARLRGNDYFQRCNFHEARKQYLIAATLDRLDYRPTWNASAACYELGQYELSIVYARKAYALVSHDDKPTKLKIALRIARSYVYLKQYTKAHEVLEPFHGDSEVAKALATTIDGAQRMERLRPAHRQTTPLSLPCYKQGL